MNARWGLVSRGHAVRRWVIPGALALLVLAVVVGALLR